MTIKRKNIRDELKHLDEDRLKDITNQNRNDFAILMQNVRADANVGVIARAANAFMAKEIIYYGCKKYNRGAAVGTHNRENITFFHDKYKLFRYIKEKKYNVICAELTDSAKSIVDFKYPPNSLIVLGNEGDGVYDSFMKIAKHVVYIPQIGAVRSLNVGVTASLFMFDWVSKALKSGRLKEDALISAAQYG